MAVLGRKLELVLTISMSLRLLLFEDDFYDVKKVNKGAKIYSSIYEVLVLQPMNIHKVLDEQSKYHILILKQKDPRSSWGCNNFFCNIMPATIFNLRIPIVYCEFTLSRKQLI